MNYYDQQLSDRDVRKTPYIFMVRKSKSIKSNKVIFATSNCIQSHIWRQGECTMMSIGVLAALQSFIPKHSNIAVAYCRRARQMLWSGPQTAIFGTQIPSFE